MWPFCSLYCLIVVATVKARHSKVCHWLNEIVITDHLTKVRSHTTAFNLSLGFAYNLLSGAEWSAMLIVVKEAQMQQP